MSRLMSHSKHTFDLHVPKQPSDRSLLRRFRSGERSAATELYLRYAKRLQALAKSQTAPVLAPRFDPEDVVQSVFRTFFRRVGEGQYDVPEGEELWKLLLVISLNKVRALGNFHRAEKRDVRRTNAAKDLDEVADEQGTSDEHSLAILQMVVEDLLGQLTPAEQKIVELRIERHDITNIASIHNGPSEPSRGHCKTSAIGSAS